MHILENLKLIGRKNIFTIITGLIVILLIVVVISFFMSYSIKYTLIHLELLIQN